MDGLDAAAKTHDIAYVDAKNLTDVRNADKVFVKQVKKSDVGKITKSLVVGAIKGKMIAEDLGILDKNKFSQITIAENNDAPQLGSGKVIKKKKPMYPDHLLRNKLSKEYGMKPAIKTGRGKRRKNNINKLIDSATDELINKIRY